MLPDRRFRPEPMRAIEAIQWLQTHNYIWVQAPMDHSPVKCYLHSKLKLWKRGPERFSVTVRSHHARNEAHTIDNGVLDRLRMPFELWHHGITATVSHVDYVGSPHEIVLHQSNGFHLGMHSLSHAINFARHQSMRLTVLRRGRNGVRERVLVPAREPISGERTF